MKVAVAGEDRVGHWIDERIDLAHIYAEISRDAAPAHLVDVAMLCDSDDTHTGDHGGARRESGISVQHWFTGRTIRLFSPSDL